MARARLTDKAVEKASVVEGQRVEIWDALLPGFGLRISYGGRKSFIVMTRVGGRQRRFTIGTYPALSLAEARGAARRLIADAQVGIDPEERRRVASRQAEQQRLHTFGAVAAEYMLDRAKALRTRAELQRKLDKDILPEWAERPIRSITRGDIRALLREKARRAPVSANRLLALISAIFNWALDEEIIESSPASRLTRPGQETERERSLSDEEIRAIWTACDDLGYPFGPLYKLLLITGQRRKEIAGMRWSDIQGTDWMMPGELSKSAKGHCVPLSDLAVEILHATPRLGGHVFSSGRRGDKPLQGWSRAKSRCDVLCGVKDWHVHDFRRTVATQMRGLGIDRLTVSKVLNHAESGITRIYDRYAADAEKRAALEKWARRLEAVLGENSEKVLSIRA